MASREPLSDVSDEVPDPSGTWHRTRTPSTPSLRDGLQSTNIIKKIFSQQRTTKKVSYKF